MSNGYLGERKRTNEIKTEKKIGFIQGLKLWANQWRLSEIKKMWNIEYNRVRYNTTMRLDKIGKR